MNGTNFYLAVINTFHIGKAVYGAFGDRGWFQIALLHVANFLANYFEIWPFVRIFHPQNEIFSRVCSKIKLSTEQLKIFGHVLMHVRIVIIKYFETLCQLCWFNSLQETKW